MRVLVFPHDLQLGGSSINAIDLAATVRAHGHEVVVFARPGPLEERLTAFDLPFLPARVPDSPRPSPRVVRSLAAAVRRHRIDLVHTYEYWPCVEAFYGAGLFLGRPVLATILSMQLPSYLPPSIPVVVGTRDLADEAGRTRPGAAYLIEPPVDTSIDRPGLDTGAFAARFGLAEPENGACTTVAIVTRVARHMKQESIERSMDAVARLARQRPPHRPVRLLVVGDGSALADVRAGAERINDAAGRAVVVLTGALADPRPAYAFADVVVGMGSSALRGMAFGKPVIVVGEQGFSLPVAPETMPVFDRTGFYGIGDGRPPAAADPLVEQLAALVDDERRRADLGQFSLRTVRDRYGLEAAAASLDRAYLETAADRPGMRRRVRDAATTSARVLRTKAAGRGLISPVPGGVRKPAALPVTSDYGERCL